MRSASFLKQLRHPNLAPLLGYFVVKYLNVSFPGSMPASKHLLQSDSYWRGLRCQDNWFRLANPVKSSAEFGYIAPECPSNMVASIEGDVDGFGVALLELIPGRKPLEICTKEEGFEGSLVNLVNKLSACGWIMDARLWKLPVIVWLLSPKRDCVWVKFVSFCTELPRNLVSFNVAMK